MNASLVVTASAEALPRGLKLARPLQAMINWGHGNDMAAANAFLPAADALVTAANGTWAGGVNSTALRMAEDRAFG